MRKIQLISVLGGILLSGTIAADVQLDLIEPSPGFGIEVYASGWLQGRDGRERPNDVLLMPNSAQQVSDDQADVIYRISFTQ